MAKPPTFRQLIQEPLYRRYLRRVPRFSPCDLTHPWQVWGLQATAVTPTPHWKSRLCDTYNEAYFLARQLHGKRDEYLDICMVSRSILHPFPRSLRGLYDPSLYTWCARCRRPSTFRFMPEGHRALKGAPTITNDEPYRCYYCGIRKNMGGKEL